MCLQSHMVPVAKQLWVAKHAAHKDAVQRFRLHCALAPVHNVVALPPLQVQRVCMPCCSRSRSQLVVRPPALWERGNETKYSNSKISERGVEEQWSPSAQQ